MNYFTPEHYARGNSPNPQDLNGIEEVWDQAVQRYRRRLRKIWPMLPEGVRRFREEPLCLHDARVLGLARKEGKFVIFLETEPPARQPVVLTFTLEEGPAFTSHAGHGFYPNLPADWLYEEWNVDRHKRPTLEVLFSNGLVLKLVFRDFEYLVAEPVAFPVNGQAHSPAPLTAARPA